MEDQTQETSVFEIFEQTAPKIYSKRVIFGFSILFSTIFGGVLLMQNLRDVDRKKEANLVLLVSILYTALVMVLATTNAQHNSTLTWLMNAIGGSILCEYFFRKNFPDENRYGKKKIWKPLLISVLIIAPFLLLAVYGA